MFVKLTVELIVTSFLFLSRVWSRPTDVVCEGGRKEGDKWFDGCRWCICQDSGPMCSISECSFLAGQLPPCHNVGSSWMDGCYVCTCYRNGIECIADQACGMLMRSERFRTDFQSQSACVEPKDDRCICGVDAVPSCTAEVIDKNAYPAVTIELIPTLSSSRLTLQENDHSGSKDHFNTKEHPMALHSLDKDQLNQLNRYSLELYSKDQETQNSKLSHTLDHHLLARLQSNKISRTYSTVMGDAERTKSNKRTELYSSHTPYNGEARKNMDIVTSRLHSQNVVGSSEVFYPPVIPTEHIYPKRSTLKNVVNGLNRKPSENNLRNQFDGAHYRNSYDSRQQIHAYSEDRDTEFYNASPSVLVVSANRCRWGSRWYGGSLRCYCGEDNSITCGDPSFVAPRIDGFRLKKAACEEGHTWNEEDSCTMCECQISGVVLCRRSPSCLLPFLIKPLSKIGDDLKDIDISSHDSNRQNEFTGAQEHKLFVNKTKAETEINLDQKQKNEHFNHDTTKNDATSQIPDIDAEFIPDDLDGSGEIKLHKTTFSWVEGGDRQTVLDQTTGTQDPLIDYTSQTNNLIGSVKNPGSVDSVGHDKQGNNEDYTTQNVYSSHNHGNHERDHKQDSDIKETTQVTTTQCKPHSRWIDGCRRCQCSEDGKKYCDDSRCPRVFISSKETPKPGNGDKQYTRPVQLPPSNIFPTRDKPIILHTTLLNPCGRFQPGDLYMDDCNICRCTKDGPMCTAKNCT